MTVSDAIVKLLLEGGGTPHDDEHFMKITIADFDPKTEEPIITYEDFDHSLIKPRARTYGSK